jgi:CHAT domain-containing protein
VPVPQLLPELVAGISRPALRPTGATDGSLELLLVGDVDYSAGSMPPPLALDADAKGNRGSQPQFVPLPGTRLEIETIRRLFESGPLRAHVNVLTGTAATTVALRREAPRARYLHLATFTFVSHGDRLNPREASGLVLAGANRDAEPGSDRGILWAEQIAELNLDGVEMAVLSASLEKWGTPLRGEGSMGVPRALQIAGVRSVVSTFWAVDDRAASEIMIRFYENLARGMTKLQALRDAQLRMMRRDRRASPAEWAAFDLIGDWR